MILAYWILCFFLPVSFRPFTVPRYEGLPKPATEPTSEATKAYPVISTSPPTPTIFEAVTPSPPIGLVRCSPSWWRRSRTPPLRTSATLRCLAPPAAFPPATLVAKTPTTTFVRCCLEMRRSWMCFPLSSPPTTSIETHGAPLRTQGSTSSTLLLHR